MPRFNFDRQRILITGGAHGIGRGIAELFADWGATVGVCDLDYQGAKETKKAIEANGGRAFANSIDVTNETSVEQAVEAFVNDVGGLDLSVNSAGILTVCQVMEMPLDEWKRVLEVNATGTFVVARAVARIMCANHRGHIVNIASIGGKTGDPGLAHYSASKFAVIGFTQALAREIGKQGVRVNAICPGTVMTDMVEKLSRGWSQSVEELVSNQVIQSPQRPEHIAAGIAGLHLNDAITGQSLNIDGGTVFH